MEPICGAQAALFVKPNSCLPLVQQPSCFLLLPSLQTLRGLQATAYSNCYSMLFYFILFYSISPNLIRLFLFLVLFAPESSRAAPGRPCAAWLGGPPSGARGAQGAKARLSRRQSLSPFGRALSRLSTRLRRHGRGVLLAALQQTAHLLLEGIQHGLSLPILHDEQDRPHHLQIQAQRALLVDVLAHPLIITSARLIKYYKIHSRL